MGLGLFDTHCHLGDPHFASIRQETLDNAFDAGVHALTVICADPQNIQDFDQLLPELRSLKKEIKIYRSAGLHPHEAQHANEELYQLIEKQLQADAVGVGETGLDYYYNFSKPEVQIPVFEQHIDWAIAYQKPLIIHTREAAKDTLRLLEREELKSHPRPGILHCFTEDMAFAKRVLDLNLYISFSGIASFKNAESIREVLRYVPLNRLLIETDSPYLAPVPHRGKKNQPAFVEAIFKLVCELRAEDDEMIKDQLWRNSCEVFQV